MNRTYSIVGNGLLALASLSAISSHASADPVYATNGPFGGPFGLIGFDVSQAQSVGLRFIPSADYTLDEISVWFMNNDFSGAIHPTVTLTVRTDNPADGTSVPSQEILETFTFIVSADGWNPVSETVMSVKHPVLEAGVKYWIVCESDAQAGLNGVWNWATAQSGFMSTIDFASGPNWQPGGEGAVAATIVNGTLLCPADMAPGGGNGLVNVEDLLFVISNWGATGGPADIAPPGGDDLVDINDLLAVISAWGTCAQ
ncbi:MAG: hypothetical protein L0Y44_09580 [Phycisphaerales bacterium]|nr:hypothetical protein [Phycisphaerales bacterium]MCI0630887.1 hypothetical protein [Phycisphaerales bacterium]MCI0676676.1 hypothetical protein [Phycisphaerales bacterium]